MRRTLTLIAAALIAGGAFAQERPDGTGDGRYIVKFRDFARGAANIAAAGGRVALELAPQRAMAAYLPEAAVRALQNNPNVEYVEMDPRRYPTAETSPWGIARVQANDPVFTGNASAGSGPMVCIIDSGLHVGHEDFAPYAASITGGSDGGRNSLTDTCGHGTHVAGTIAAVGNNAKGVVGVNPKGNLRLHIEKVFDGASCTWSYASNLVAALNNCESQANLQGSNLVINMSLGGSTASTEEDNAFQAAYASGKVLSIASAGNGGNTTTSYPAGYASVISVAATDSSDAKASFSQVNADVELAAPGVGVLSTTPFKVSSIQAGAARSIGANIEGSARKVAVGLLVNGGQCLTSNAGWLNKVVLCERGVNSFGEKVSAVRAGNGVAAVIYNNVAGGFSGTLGRGKTSTIPAISISREDGLGLGELATGTVSATVDNAEAVAGVAYSGYEFYDGTSMAAPHVTGVAALVWSLNVTKTNAQIRGALQQSALDLGAPGRDTSFGFGLVRAKVAHDVLQGASPPPQPLTISGSITTRSRKFYANLKWSGATGSTVDVYRDSAMRINTGNDGIHEDGPLTAGVTYRYKICTAGTTTCSNEIELKP